MTQEVIICTEGGNDLHTVFCGLTFRTFFLRYEKIMSHTPVHVQLIFIFKNTVIRNKVYRIQHIFDIEICYRVCAPGISLHKYLGTIDFFKTR